MNLCSLIIEMLIFNCIYTGQANNATHGNFAHALYTCRKSGGFAPPDIINSLSLGKLQVENCAVAKSLALDDGESLWTHYRAELGAYIAPFGCAKTLPTDFKESMNSTNVLYECTIFCSRTQPKIKYIGILNKECYCMADQGSFTNTKCHNVSNLNSATVAIVYELIEISVEREVYACITSVLRNNSRKYYAAKCSGKHQGMCTGNKRDGYQVQQRNCLNYKDKFDSIGRNICILKRNMFKGDIEKTCSSYSAKMPPIIYQGMDKYLTNDSESFFLSSARTFRIVENALFSIDNSTMTCASLYKRGCKIFIEPDRCQNINRFRCQYTTISREQTEMNAQNDTATLFAILIPTASLLILAICFFVRFNYVKRTCNSAVGCIRSVNPETLEQEHVRFCMYDYATTSVTYDRPTRRQNIYSVSEDIILNEQSNTDPLHEKDNTICPQENKEYDVTITSGRGALQPNTPKAYTCNHLHLGINAGEYDHIRSHAEPTVSRK